MRALGELEERLMAILWDESPLSVRDVGARLKRSKLAYTTILTTLDRLHTKGLLARTKQGKGYLYMPAIDRTEYQRRVVERVRRGQECGPTLCPAWVWREPPGFVDLSRLAEAAAPLLGRSS